MYDPNFSSCFVDGVEQPFETKDSLETGTSEVLPVKRSRVDNVPMSRVDFLLSREQMTRDGYPLPFSQSGQLQY